MAGWDPIHRCNTERGQIKVLLLSFEMKADDKPKVLSVHILLVGWDVFKGE
jgi:hypothetical protein